MKIINITNKGRHRFTQNDRYEISFEDKGITKCTTILAKNELEAKAKLQSIGDK